MWKKFAVVGASVFAFHVAPALATPVVDFEAIALKGADSQRATEIVIGAGDFGSNDETSLPPGWFADKPPSALPCGIKIVGGALANSPIADDPLELFEPPDGWDGPANRSPCSVHLPPDPFTGGELPPGGDAIATVTTPEPSSLLLLGTCLLILAGRASRKRRK